MKNKIFFLLALLTCTQSGAMEKIYEQRENPEIKHRTWLGKLPKELLGLLVIFTNPEKYHTNRLYWCLSVLMDHTQGIPLPAQAILADDVVLSQEKDFYAATHHNLLTGKNGRTELYRLQQNVSERVLSVPFENGDDSLTSTFSLKQPLGPQFNPHARQLIVAKTRYNFLVIDPATQAIIAQKSTKDPITSIQFCPNQNILILNVRLSGDHRKYRSHILYDANTWQEKAELNTETVFSVFCDNTGTIAVNFNGNMNNHRPYRTVLWDLVSSKAFGEIESRIIPAQECFTRDNKLILLKTTAQEMALEVYNPKAPRDFLRKYEIRPAQPYSEISFNFSRNKNCAAVSNNGFCFLIDTKNGTIRKIPLPLHPHNQFFDPTGNFLATKAHTEPELNIYETEKASHVARILLPHSQLTLRADSFFADGTLKLFDGMCQSRGEHFEEHFAKYLLFHLMHKQTLAWFASNDMSYNHLLFLDKVRKHICRAKTSQEKLNLEPNKDEERLYKSMPTELQTTMNNLLPLKKPKLATRPTCPIS